MAKLDELITRLAEDEAEGTISQILAFGAEAFGPLLAALGSDDAHTRANAADALGELGNGRAVEYLIQALADSVSAVRVSAALALGELADARAVPALQNALADGETSARGAAILALGQTGKLRM